MRRATSIASTAPNTRLKPQLIHEHASVTNVTSATAPRGVRGHDAMARISRPIGGDVASTCPVMMMSAICIVNGISSQKPRPHASTTCGGVDGVAISAARKTMTVASSAKMNASGTQRSAQSVSASAARATSPGSSAIRGGGYLNIGAPHGPVERKRGRSSDSPQDPGVLVHRLDLRFLRSPAAHVPDLDDDAEGGFGTLDGGGLDPPRHRA